MDHCIVERRGGSLNKEIVWWSARREFNNKKYSGDHCMVERQGGKFK